MVSDTEHENPDCMQFSTFIRVETFLEKIVTHLLFIPCWYIVTAVAYLVSNNLCSEWIVPQDTTDESTRRILVVLSVTVLLSLVVLLFRKIRRRNDCFCRSRWKTFGVSLLHLFMYGVLFFVLDAFTLQLVINPQSRIMVIPLLVFGCLSVRPTSFPTINVLLLVQYCTKAVLGYRPKKTNTALYNQSDHEDYNKGVTDPIDQKDEVKHDKPVENWDIDKILEWSRYEDPIDNVINDYFGGRTTAKKIIDFITDGETIKKGNCLPRKSIGLVGEFGSGKSSIINLALERLKSRYRDSIIIHKVNCWGFASSQAALQHLMCGIVEALEKEGIDTVLLKSLPSRYLASLSQSSSCTGWLRIILEDMGLVSKDDSQSILCELANELMYSEKHLFLVIENIDRNNASDFNYEDIVATLHRFKELVAPMSLIIAGFPDYEHHSIDFDKLCDHVIYVPKIDYSFIKKLMLTIIKYHKEKYSDDINVIDFFPGNQLPLEYPHDPNQLIDGLSLTERTAYNLAWTDPLLLQYCNNPRTLKHLIRSLNTAWDTLHGECDYAELLVLHAIQYTKRPVFNYINTHISDFRYYRKRKHRESKTSMQFQEETLTFLQEKQGPYYEWAMFWLNYLFPNITAYLVVSNSIVTTNTEKRDSWDEDRPILQRISENNVVDYFNRIVFESIPDSTLRDQTILSAIHNCNKENYDELARILVELPRSECDLVLRWKDAIKPKRIPQLTESVLLQWFESHTEEVSPPECLITVTSLWSSYNGKHFENTNETLNTLFRKILPSNIHFASDILYRLGTGHDFVSSVIPSATKCDSSGLQNFQYEYFGLPLEPTDSYLQRVRENADKFLEVAKSQLTDYKRVISCCISSEEGDKRQLFTQSRSLRIAIHTYCGAYSEVYANSIIKRYNPNEKQENVPVDERTNSDFPNAEYIEKWNWLGPILLDGMRTTEEDVKTKCSLLTVYLIIDFDDRPNNGDRVDEKKKYKLFRSQDPNKMWLDCLFGDSAKEVCKLFVDDPCLLPDDMGQNKQRIMQTLRERFSHYTDITRK